MTPEAVAAIKGAVDAAAAATASPAVSAPGGPTAELSELAEAELEVELELLAFEKAKEPYEMDSVEKLAAQARAKARGNVHYGRGELKAAVRKYTDSNNKAPKPTDFAPDDMDAERKLASGKAVQLSSLLNLAACHLKLQQHSSAVLACTEALAIDGANVKGLFRRGQARHALGKDEEAKSDLLEAARRDPQNREVRKELEAVKVALSARDREDQKLFSKMLSPAAPAGTLV